MALHPHRPVGREQDRAGSIALAGVQARFLQLGLDRSGGCQAPPGVQAGAHAGDDAALGIARPVGHEGQIRPPCRHLDQMPVAPQLTHIANQWDGLLVSLKLEGETCRRTAVPSASASLPAACLSSRQNCQSVSLL